MKYQSRVNLTSAPLAGERVSYFKVDPEIVTLLRQMGVEDGAPRYVARDIIEGYLKRCTPAQVQGILAKIGKLIA